MDTIKIIKDICSAIEKAQSEEINYSVIFESENVIDYKNEFLFFIKPEITKNSSQINLPLIFEHTFDRMAFFGMSVKNIKLLSAKYLKKHNIIAQHYGVINKISANAKEEISDEARAKFKEIFGKKTSECVFLGGLEFLQRYSQYNAVSLMDLWLNHKGEKLAGGTYVIKTAVEGEEIFIVNGFHPNQLIHFTEKARSIVVFTLVSDIDWSNARYSFIGATNPELAEKGSLRKVLYENKDIFGLEDVSQSMNGAHLSAGPVEGLVELMRYNSNFEVDKNSLSYKHFNFGKKLTKNFSDVQIQDILSNVNLQVNGKKISVFDLTEEKNSDVSIELLKKIVL